MWPLKIVYLIVVWDIWPSLWCALLIEIFPAATLARLVRLPLLELVRRLSPLACGIVLMMHPSGLRMVHIPF